jgi:hypothetical protein
MPPHVHRQALVPQCPAKEAGTSGGSRTSVQVYQLAAILEIMEDEPINVHLYREASDAPNQAISEIERLRSDAELHRKTCNARRAMPLLRLKCLLRSELSTCNTPSSIWV